MIDNLIIKIILLSTGLGCIIFSIWSLILITKIRKLKIKINNIKYWISSIDKDALVKSSPHDVRYLEEARKILNSI